MRLNFKKAILGFLFALAVPVLVSAHSVTGTFTKSTDDTGATGSGYTTWRLSGTCPTNPTTTTGFTSLNSTPYTVATFTDSTVTPGTYCYVVTFSNSTATSVPSNTASAVIQPAAPLNLTITNVSEFTVPKDILDENFSVNDL